MKRFVTQAVLLCGLCGFVLLAFSPPADAVYYIKKKKTEQGQPFVPQPKTDAPGPYVPKTPSKETAAKEPVADVQSAIAPQPVPGSAYQPLYYGPCTDQDRAALASLQSVFAYNDTLQPGDDQTAVKPAHFDKIVAFYSDPKNVQTIMFLNLRCGQNAAQNTAKPAKK